jgi:NADPH-dependent 2,4-dienoyl-CoA reductase/sulfur reductase-like enzyme/rhodanese-related sulfurtransferase
MESLKIVIVGGVAGGASTATRLRRLDEKAQIVILERGEHVSFANCGLPYHIGGAIKRRGSLLLQTPKSLRDRFNLDVRVRHEVLAIDRAAKSVLVLDLATGETYREAYDKLVLSPGASPIRPPIAGVEHTLSLRSMSDMDAIKRRVDAGGLKRAVVVGGGFIGLEVAENLVERGVQVSVVEAAPQVMIALDLEMAAIVQEELRRKGVTLHLGDGLDHIGDDGRTVVLKSGERLPADLIVLAIGVRPETGLAREAGLTIGSRGGILVNDSLQTSDPDVYAVGDAVQKLNLLGDEALVPLAWAANRQGRLVADHIKGRRTRFSRQLGTAVAKVFDLTVASTGLNEKALAAGSLPYQAIHTHPRNHAGYYPGGETISLKLLFDPTSGRIYGAQAVGGAGTEKRIDVLATVIKGGLTAPELADLELAYAPPYSSAKDPVNMLGYVAENLMDGERTVQWNDLVPGSGVLLDVRDLHEFEAGHIEGAFHVPLNDLRARHGELPGKNLIVYCQIGQRAHTAVSLLRQLGYRASNLDGGYQTFALARPEAVARPTRDYDAELAAG